MVTDRDMSSGNNHARQPQALQLLLDVGSSRCKWQLLGASQRPAGVEIQTGSLEDLRAALNTSQAAGACVRSAAGICVAAAGQREAVDDLLQSACGLSLQWLHTESRVADLRCGYPQPQQLGVDRWAGLAGAHSLYPHDNVILADFGTATTVDFLAAGGQHLGGWISAGLQDGLSALRQRLAHLPALSGSSNAALLAAVAVAPGENDANLAASDTRSALVHGSLHAQAGLVMQARAVAQRAGWPSCRVLLTGGNAQRLLPLLDTDVVHQPQLLFVGMQWLLRHSS